MIDVGLSGGLGKDLTGFRAMQDQSKSVVRVAHVTETPAYLTLWFPIQIVGGIAVGLLLVGLSGAAVSGMAPARFGVGGAVNNAVRQLGGVFGTALVVVLVGQTGAGIEAFRTAFLCLGLIGLAVAVLCLPLPRQSGRVVPDCRVAPWFMFQSPVLS